LRLKLFQRLISFSVVLCSDAGSSGKSRDGFDDEETSWNP